HDPDAASRNGALSEARAGSRGPALVQVRHAPRAVGAAPGRPPVLRALRRDLAALDPEHGRREDLDRLDAPDPPDADPVPHARPHAHAADDEGAGVHGRARGELRRGGGGSVPGARSVLTDSALATLLPDGETLSRHEIRIAAPPARVWDALMRQDV